MNFEYRQALTKLATAKLQAINSLGADSEVALLKLVERSFRHEPANHLIAASAEFDLLEKHTYKNVPRKSGMYLKLSHGRSTVDEYLSNWGVDGPYIGPLSWFHGTYLTDMRMALAGSDEIIDLSFSSEIPSPIYFAQDKLYYDGIYYADWEVQQIVITKRKKQTNI